MKIHFSILFGAIMTMNSVPLYASAETDVRPLLRAPLIIGASVSAGFGTTSPARRLTRRYYADDPSRTLARSGTTAKSLLSTLKESDLKDRSLVIGMDLFFWDSVYGSAAGVTATLNSLLERTKKLGLPLIIGDVPEILAGHQSNREAVNVAIRKNCTPANNCVILPLEKLFKKLLADGSIHSRGKEYSLLDLMPDGLHLSAPASDFCADQIEDALKGSTLRVK